jgi:hypothetical protein
MLRSDEFKWNLQKANRFPKTFLEAYPGSSSSFVNPGDFEKFVGWGKQGH